MVEEDELSGGFLGRAMNPILDQVCYEIHALGRSGSYTCMLFCDCVF